MKGQIQSSDRYFGIKFYSNRSALRR